MPNAPKRYIWPNSPLKSRSYKADGDGTGADPLAHAGVESLFECPLGKNRLNDVVYLKQLRSRGELIVSFREAWVGGQNDHFLAAFDRRLRRDLGGGSWKEPDLVLGVGFQVGAC